MTFSTRARTHLASFPLVLPRPTGHDDDIGGEAVSMAAQKAMAADPGLLGALGGLTSTELRALLGPLPPRTEEGLILGIYDRVATDMRVLGTARLESALVAARRASHEPGIASKLGRLAARFELGAGWLQAAGVGPAAVRRLADRAPLAADVDTVRALYAMHRPTFADLRVRLSATPVWTPAALPTLREAILATAGLSSASPTSLVRSAVGGHPWGTGQPLPPSKLGSRAAARMLIESLRHLGLTPSTLGAGLVLLAGLYDQYGKSDDTTGARTLRTTTPPTAKPVIARDVTATMRIG